MTPFAEKRMRIVLVRSIAAISMAQDGFGKLSDADVRGAVNYMIVQSASSVLR